MRNQLIRILLILLISVNVIAQSTGHFRFCREVQVTMLNTSNGGYISTGITPSGYARVSFWNTDFTLNWSKVIYIDSIVDGQEVTQITEANDGNFYYKLNTSKNGGSFFIIKISLTGDILWQRSYDFSGGSLYAQAIAPACPGDNGFIVGSGNCALSGFIMKGDENGEINWQHSYSSPTVIGGVSYGYVLNTFGIFPEADGYAVFDSKYQSIMNIKIDSLGNFISDKVYAYPEEVFTYPRKIALLPNGSGYGMIGRYNSDPTSQYVAFFDKSQNLLSFNKYTAPEQFNLYNLSATSSGSGIVANGGLYSGSEKFRGIILNVSTGGMLQWYHAVPTDTVTAFPVLEYFGSQSLPDGYSLNAANSSIGAMITILDSNGNGACNSSPISLLDSAKTLLFSTDDVYTYACTIVSHPEYYAYDTGFTADTGLYCGTIPEFVPLSMNNLNTPVEYSVYPNPVTGVLHLDGLTSAGSYIIRNMIGQVTARGNLSMGTNAINMQALPTGVYLLEVQSNATKKIVKMIKE